ncbi:myophilin [Biomphalaria glabrata]|uniref:Transgelin n=2 Tax=Biomphalaria TaxID=6525 RepID=A0A2C9JCM8_BIOGL|nr:myophilin-like [Biomphalaria glabrata]KAI8742575.1 myophilin-like [Biomphalaria glabrata]KAI8772703.1 myophilin [Biomphalaria glabrata]KAK0047280.1 myophilin [Biomphalaria pfeifferi]
MAAHRAAKSGIALEAQQKMDSKWDNDRARVAIDWVGKRIGEHLETDGSKESVYNLLKDGMVLAKLANWVRPGSVAAAKMSKAPSLAFKQMELIGMFLKTIDEGEGGCVKKSELFQTVDLYEKVNMVQVITTLEALGRAMLTQGREGFGKAESKGQTHEWTEEQLKAGQNIIGLQMGTNKGANQSGQNFGKTRAIVD